MLIHTNASSIYYLGFLYLMKSNVYQNPKYVFKEFHNAKLIKYMVPWLFQTVHKWHGLSSKFFYGIHAFKYSLKVDTTLISLPMCWGGRGLIGNLYHHHTAFSCPLWPEAIEFIHTPTRKCKVPEQILETEKDAFNLFNVLFYIFLPGRYLLTLHNKLTSSESNFI